MLTARQVRQLRQVPSANRLKAARSLIKRTQMQVSRDLGIHQSSLSQWESGDPNITLDTAYMFATYFGCAVEDLFPPLHQRMAS